MTEAATVTDEPRRCLGTNQDGTPCGTGPELLMPSGWCFAHDPARGADRTASATLGGIKSMAKRRRGLDPGRIGALETAADAKRILALLATALATGEMPAPAGRAALVAVKEWLHAHDVDELEQRIAELEREARARKP